MASPVLRERIYVRIGSRVDSSGRRVTTLQVSRDGLSWSGTGLELSGSEDDLLNMNTCFLGVSTINGTGQLEEVAQQTYRILYAASTANGSGHADIFESEIGLGEMILRLPVLLEGDYNGDLVVDTLDYQAWVTTFGSTTDFAADGNRNGIVDAADYAVWRNNLGATFAAVATVGAVPEPSLTLPMLLAAQLMA